MNDELTQFLMLGAFALGSCLACKAVLDLSLGNHRWRTGMQWLFAGAGVAVAVLLAVDAIDGIDENEQSSLASLQAVLICGWALVSLPLHAHVAAFRMPARELVGRPSAWLLLLWSVGACGWAGVRFYDVATPRANELASQPHPEMEAEKQAIAVSDQGRPIPLFHMHAPIADWPRGFQAMTPALARMKQTVISTAKSDASSNCHGWVFARGNYLIDGNGVLTILADNGYQMCQDPRPGDLIVYWSGRFVAHTGLVSGILADGTVIIESKWNLQERFLHRPEDQPYSRTFSYYRTPRGNHAITIRDEESAR